MKQRPVFIMAGGTGGHVIPALSVAAELAALNVPVRWLGAKQGIESRLVPDANIPIHYLPVTGLRGRGLLGKVKAIFQLIIAVMYSVGLMLKWRPQAVLGMGGYASGPGGIAAWLTGRRLVVHEQNAVAGMTNRWLARVATVVAYAFAGAFPSQAKTIRVANPVRKDIENIPHPNAREFTAGTLNILVVGGSQGARALNEAVPAAVKQMRAQAQVSVWHQCGRGAEEATVEHWQGSVIEPQVAGFVSDMAAAWTWAHVVICRSGALTVAECAAAGVASVFVPFPFAVDDHQTANAQALVDAGAAIIMQENTLDITALARLLDHWVQNRNEVLVMANAARDCAECGTAAKLANICMGAAA